MSIPLWFVVVCCMVYTFACLRAAQASYRPGWKRNRRGSRLRRWMLFHQTLK
jgi:hypothetical protein